MIDYREIPEVKEAIERYNAFPEDDSRRTHLLWAVGKDLSLDIEVTDPELFRLTCVSMFTDKSPLSIPGAKINCIHFDASGKLKIRKFLEEQLKNLDNS